MSSLCGCLKISDYAYYKDKELRHPNRHSDFRNRVAQHLADNPMCMIRAMADKVWLMQQPTDRENQ